MPEAPHPALKTALEALRFLQANPRDRDLLREVAGIYHQKPRPWPEAVPAPFQRVFAPVLRAYPGLPPADLTLLANLIQALGLWRLTKGAYLYDPDLFRELVATPIGRVPVELLKRLPEPAPLLLFPEPLPFLPGVLGAHVLLDWDENPPAHLKLRFLLWMGTEQVANLILALTAPTLQEALEATLALARESTRALAKEYPVRGKAGDLLSLLPEEAYADAFQALLNLALYLCQEAPDLGASPRPPAEARLRKGRLQVQPPEAPLVIPTGWRWGRALRAFREAKAREEGRRGGGKSPAPHIRRAHWHLYWTGEGARKDPALAKPQIRWVPATLVGRKWLLEAGLSEEDLPAVVRKVEK